MHILAIIVLLLQNIFRKKWKDIKPNEYTLTINSNTELGLISKKNIANTGNTLHHISRLESIEIDRDTAFKLLVSDKLSSKVEYKRVLFLDLSLAEILKFLLQL